MLPTTSMRRIDTHVVCGGRWHDFDFVRRQVLDLLATDERIRATVASDYSDTGRLETCELLVSYTCDVRPGSAEISRLRSWVEQGGTWLALHGTNAALDETPEGFSPAEGLADLWQLIGSRFVAHPPIEPYEVRFVSDDPLVRGIGPFTVADELYLMELPDPDGIDVLAVASYGGHARGFANATWPVDDRRPVVYVRRVGTGRIWYCTLGHCRGRFDMHPEVELTEASGHGSWDVPEFRELVRRGCQWAVGAIVPGSEDG